MLRRTLSTTAALGGLALVAAGATGTPLAAQADLPDLPAVGPPYDFTTELLGGNGTAIPLKNAAMLTRTAHGYVYWAGQQDSHLVIRPVKGGLRFSDTGSAELRELAGACKRKKARAGIAAVCKVPGTVSTRLPLLVEVWPRLGDDYVDGSKLPATVALAVLGDAGNDVARLGAGPDFFNGAFGRDKVWGGAGNDWLRTGDSKDRVHGGAGDDLLVGVDGPDVLVGGTGDDRIFGGNGNDRLRAGDGDRDLVTCGDDDDSAVVDPTDAAFGCEALSRR